MEGTVTTGMEAIWTGVGDFIGGLIDAMGGAITGFTSQPILLVFVFVMPLAFLAIRWVLKLIKSKRKG